MTCRYSYPVTNVFRFYEKQCHISSILRSVNKNLCVKFPLDKSIFSYKISIWKMLQITIFLYHLILNYYLMIHYIRQKRNIWLDISCNSIHGHQDHHQWLVVSHTQTFVGTYTLQVVVNETDDDFLYPLKEGTQAHFLEKEKCAASKRVTCWSQMYKIDSM